MSDGREISVIFTDLDSIRSISKDDWKEINVKIQDAISLVQSNIYKVNFLRSIGQLPDKEKYQKALEIVRDYEAIERNIAEEKGRIIEPELKKIFGTHITNFKYRVEQNFSPTDFKIVVFPIEPEFDEDYDGIFDKDMKTIGDKFGIRVFMNSGIYSK